MQMGTLGERLRQKRKQRGLSQQKLGDLAGLSKSTIRDLELGESQGTTRLHHIAFALKVHLAWLENGSGPEDLNASGDEPTKNATIGSRSASQIDESLAPILAQAESWVRFEEKAASLAKLDLWGPHDGLQSVRRATRIILFMQVLQAHGGDLVREEAVAVIDAARELQQGASNGAASRGRGGGAAE